ncbi:hypothetical protein DEO72_LG11g1405 [Vigna unguiculata]|uniref:Uncharacterized protein n=1 Tax=Vigna unguiculata TaxID=3917 RepID=A0A4D6NQ76_VIGUN|nr:hypothetical protein DEO72_LG11g1405 [Vigna unguiculata]
MGLRRATAFWEDSQCSEVAKKIVNLFNTLNKNYGRRLKWFRNKKSVTRKWVRI